MKREKMYSMIDRRSHGWRTDYHESHWRRGRDYISSNLNNNKKNSKNQCLIKTGDRQRKDSPLEWVVGGA